MSDDIKLDQDDSKKSSDEKPVTSRRKFAKTGLGGGAVLMSLLSRPALGGTNCSVSVLESIRAGSSLHPVDFTCSLSCGVDYWVDDNTFAPDVSFEAVFGCGQLQVSTTDARSPTLREVLSGMYFAPSPPTTGLDAAVLDAAVKESAAAWLNAGFFTPNFEDSFGNEVTQSAIETAFCNAFSMDDLTNHASNMAALNNAGTCPMAVTP